MELQRVGEEILQHLPKARRLAPERGQGVMGNCGPILDNRALQVPQDTRQQSFPVRRDAVLDLSPARALASRS